MPTPEFRESLERELMRALRSDAQFDPPSMHRRTRRVAMVAGLAAGAVVMLTIGLVLGASTGYASAREIVNERGDTPLPPQPTLSVLRNIPNITSLSCVGSVTAATLPPVKQGPAIVDLPAASVRTNDSPLRGVLGVRETPSGLLVDDAGRRQLKLYDASSLALQTIVRDSAPGSANSYGRQMVPIIRYLGDSSVFFDNASGTMLILGPTGQVARAFAGTGNDMNYGMQLGPGAVDEKGRLVYSWKLSTDYMRPTSPGVPDSEAVFRADLETRHIDTLTKIRVTGSMGMMNRGDGITRLYTDPIATVDNWAQLSDGSIAVVRGQDYHIDWYLPDGTVKSTPKLPFDWKRMTDDDKLRLIDSTENAVLAEFARNPGRGGGRPPASSDGGGRGGARGYSPGGGEPEPNAPARKYQYVRPELKDLPDYYPAIRPHAAMPDLAGNLWILPTSSAQSKNGELVYDVVNAKGGFHRVRFPVGRSLAGFGANGTVYMLAGDKTNGFWIEKTKLPAR